MGDQEQSHRDEMNAAIRAQRERQAALRLPAAPEPEPEPQRPAGKTARIMARLRRK